MENKKLVLAVQLPAPCPLNCEFCRTPNHTEGDRLAVLTTVEHLISQNHYDEIYLTSTGETGLSKNFKEIVLKAQSKGIPISVLCATKCSIIPGLKRIEISFNRFTQKTATLAIRKAKELNIPVIVSVVDEGIEKIVPENIIKQLEVDGILVRALQKEGRSIKECGTSSFYSNGSEIGIFPVTAYKELRVFGDNAQCVNHYGKIVPFLGSVG